MHIQTAARTAPKPLGNVPAALLTPRDPQHDACMSCKDVLVDGRWYRVYRTDGRVAVWVSSPGSTTHHTRDLVTSSTMAQRVRAASGWFRKPEPALQPPLSTVDRAAAHHEREVEQLARDIEAVIGRQESVKDDDLLTLGWSLPQIAELAPDALKRVRGRAVRHLDPIN